MTDCLIISARADEYADRLAALAGLRVATTACASAAEALQRYAGQRVAFGDPDLVAPILQEMPAVEWVQSTWAGVLHFGTLK